MPRLKSLLSFCLIVALTTVSGIRPGSAQETRLLIEIQGRTLDDWVDQATRSDGPEDLAKTVSALSIALKMDNPMVKVAAADALATLGPRAAQAVPALLEQFGHEFPWVRVSCQAAVGSVGKAAVPSLIDTLENNTGGPRVRAAFVLGSIGPDAVAAVPALVRTMEKESPAMQTRIAGVLGQIAPEQFSPQAVVKKATYDGPDASSISTLETSDWPEFHGPARDSLCREKGLLQNWPEGGPKLLWSLKGLGRGYSTISIAHGTIFTMGDRPEPDGAEAQFVIAFDLQTRQERWTSRIGPPHTDGGPRCTPTVDGDRVFAIGTGGDLVCLDVKDGSIRWQRNFVDDFKGAFMSVWKFSESPLIDGNQLICTPGGPDAVMVALDKRSGETIWKCAMPEIGEKGADGAGYSSAIVAEICGVRQYVQMVGRGVIGVDAKTGRFLWGYNFVANNVANITSPIARGDYVFASTAYNTGSVLLKITRDGLSFDAKEVYFMGARDFQNHHGGVVLVGNYLYGGHGPNRGDPTCVEFATGKVVWKQRAPARGSAAVLYADGQLIFRYDRGEVLLVESTPKQFTVNGHFKAKEDEGPAWAHPVIHQGKLYLRHADLLLCYDVRAYR